MRIVSYEQMKGVWGGRHYPIVWYLDTWEPPVGTKTTDTKTDDTKKSSVWELFQYDEKFNSDIVKRIVDSNSSSLQPISDLEKIFEDLDMLNEIENLKKGVGVVIEVPFQRDIS